jgi:cellulose synthase/poly-beta-1,6-N-acetylglucosamine synthase-like glycosyltransferase
MEAFSNIFIYTLLFLTLYFEVFLLVTYVEERSTFSTTLPRIRLPEDYPSVTIVVPAWNESKTIGGTVASLLALDYPKDRG